MTDRANGTNDLHGTVHIDNGALPFDPEMGCGRHHNGVACGDRVDWHVVALRAIIEDAGGHQAALMHLMACDAHTTADDLPSDTWMAHPIGPDCGPDAGWDVAECVPTDDDMIKAIAPAAFVQRWQLERDANDGDDLPSLPTIVQLLHQTSR